MKKLKRSISVFFASCVLLVASSVDAALVRLTGSTGEGDVFNVSFHVVDATNIIDQISGTVNVAGIGPLTIGGLLSPAAVEPWFLINNTYNTSDLSPTGFDWYGVGFSLGDLTANFYDENPQGSGPFIFAARGPGVDATAHIPGHVITQFEIFSSNDVPEPGSLALLGLGMAGLLASWRRFPKNAPMLKVCAI